MATPNDIYNEITRIDNAKQGIAEAIEEKGVQVPAGTPIQDFPGKVRQIQTGSPDAVLYTPQDLTPEQQEQARENIGAYTKPETGIPAADLAEPVQQELAKAGTAYQKPGTGIPKTDLANGVQTSLEKADTALQPAALTPITELIPEQATPQNQLADKNFVNSSVATNTANYISDNDQPFQSVADLEAYTGPLTNNDYAFVVGTDSAGNTTYTRYKYNATTQTWAAEYVLNNSSFTAEQWAAISSGITALLVQKLSELPTEIVTYVAQTLTDAQKQQARTNIGATAPEIFWATYGTTTAAEIDAAVAAGKIPVVYYQGMLYVFANNSDATNIYFTTVYGSVNFYYARVNRSTSVWSKGTIGIQPVSLRTADIIGNRDQTIMYPNTKGVFDLVGKWGVVSQTQTWTTSTGYDPRTYAMSNLVYGIIPQSDIDLYTAAGATFNETTGYFELNGLTDISYNEMRNIYIQTCDFIVLRVDRQYNFSSLHVRTLLPYKTATTILPSTSYFWCFYDGKWEVLPNLGKTSSLSQCFRANPYLRKIGNLDVSEITTTGRFSNFTAACFSLVDVEFKGLKVDVIFSSSSALSLQSVVYMVENAANTTAITITLHATAYARCQADTTEYTYNGQTYTGVIAYAAAKNITITSA